MKNYRFKVLILVNVVLGLAMFAPRAYAEHEGGTGTCQKEVGTVNRYCCQDCTAHPYNCHIDSECEPRAE